MTTPEFGIDEARTVANRFGVAIEQVRRDHLISHILAAISRDHGEEVTFFGGTALARTLLPDGRLSEDVDLVALESRADTAAALEKTLASALRRSHGRIGWAPALTAVRDTQAAVLMAEDGRLNVRVQLLDRRSYEPWPTSVQSLDHAAPRDLWDLWALAQHAHITAEAAELFVANGPTHNVPQPWMFTSAPPEDRWREQLAGQMRLTVTAAKALGEVAAAWAAPREGVGR